MHQVWSKSIEGCWFSSIHKDVTERRTDGSVTISLRNFVGEEIIKQTNKQISFYIHVCKKKNIEQWLPISLWQDYLPWIYLQNKTHFMNTFYCNFPTKLYMYVFWHWVNDNKWTYHLFDDKLSSAISFWLQNCYAWCDIFIDWGNYILVV